MPDRPLTLSMLGGLEADVSGGPISPAARKKLLTAMSEVATVQGLSAFNIGERLLKFVSESVNKPVAGIMEEVWSQRKELREIAEKKDSRDVEGKVELFDHSITFALHPSVELQANGVKVGPTMTFDFKVDLKLQGIMLVMKNAWITQIEAGKLTSTINLEYKEIPLMPECKKTIDLSRSFDLPGGGIRLGGEPRRPALA